MTFTPTVAISQSPNAHRNSLNLFRLILAIAVLVSHAHALAGRTEPQWQGRSLGTWAVAGFFLISGYLITASRLRTHFSEYLVHRIARIFPAFLVCLVVVVVVFAPFAYLVQHGTFDGYLTTPNTPLNYVFDSAKLRMGDYSVAGTPADVPHPMAWNGSLWSLYYEFICYLVIGVLAILPVVKRAIWPIAFVFALSVVAHANTTTVLDYFGGNIDVALLLPLLPYFMGGALLFALRKRLHLTFAGPRAGGIAIGCALVGGGLTLWQPMWGPQLAAPLFAYAIMCLAHLIPSPRIVQTNDVSYGVYIYTFPIQQALVILGLHEWFVPYMVVTLALVLIPATLSWIYIERPIMTRVRTYDTAAVRAPLVAEPAM